MQFKAKRFNLDEDEFGVTNTGEPLWIVAQSGVTEGFVHDLNPEGDPAKMEDPVKRDEAVRQSNWKIVGLIRQWNFDDADTGVTLPLPKDLKESQFEDDPFDSDSDAPRLTAHDKFIAERNRILAQVPIPLFPFLAKELVQGARLTDRQEGFSKTSSGR